MKSLNPRAGCPKKPRYMVAMVLGTALTAFGSSAQASEGGAQPSEAVSAISRYCTACWRNARLHPDSWTDCTQEVLCRLLDRVPVDQWDDVLASEGEERRELIRAIDTVKKRTQRSRNWSLGNVELAADPREEAGRRLAGERAEVREASAETLSPRQQRIVEMSLDGWSVHDIARTLRLPAPRVSDEKYKAIQKLRDRLASALA